MERELLTRLGLPHGASEAEIDSAHEEIAHFLESAPADLRGWARQRAAENDEAFALLSDRTALGEAAAAASSVKPAPGAAPRLAQVAAPGRRAGSMRRWALGGAAVLAIVLGGWFVYTSDLPNVPAMTGTPAPEAPRQLDTTRVAQLMEVIAANPDDVEAMQQLADVYFDAADYSVAASWETKILAVDPANITAHLAYGAAQYNLGNEAEAEVHWRKVIELDPDDVNALAEAHYDLGFMYFSADPPDIEQTITEWRLVLEIAPGSDIAQTVSTHLETLEEWQASPAATPGATPGAGQSPAPSPQQPSARPSP